MAQTRVKFTLNGATVDKNLVTPWRGVHSGSPHARRGGRALRRARGALLTDLFDQV